MIGASGSGKSSVMRAGLVPALKGAQAGSWKIYLFTPAVHPLESLAISLTSTLQVYKMWALHAIDATLDVVGPAGLYAAEEYGSRLHLIFGGCLAAWAIPPLAAATLIFARRPPL